MGKLWDQVLAVRIVVDDWCLFARGPQLVTSDSYVEVALVPLVIEEFEETKDILVPLG